MTAIRITSRGFGITASLLIYCTVVSADDRSNVAIAALRLVQEDHHLVFETPLPAGRYSLANVLPDAKGMEGFIYSTDGQIKDGVASRIRIFQMRMNIPGSSTQRDAASRRIAVRMRASTTPGYYTLFYDVIDLAEPNKITRSAILRRDCCGYALELNAAPFAGKSFRGINMSIIERDFADAYAEFLSIARLCSIQGFHVAPESSQTINTVAIPPVHSEEQ